MKYLSLFIITLLFSLPGKAQEKSSFEVGISSSGIFDNEFLLKKQRKENTYTALYLDMGPLRPRLTGLLNPSTFSLSLANEKRKNITRRISFIRGIGGHFGYDSSTVTAGELSYKERVSTVGVFYKLGFNSTIKEKWNISLESHPGFYSTIESTPSSSSVRSSRLGFNSDILKLGLTYGFGQSRRSSRKAAY